MSQHTLGDWLKIGGQWLVISGMVVGVLLHLEHRMTSVEVAISEQMKGYAIMFNVLSQRLDSLERRLDAKGA